MLKPREEKQEVDGRTGHVGGKPWGERERDEGDERDTKDEMTRILTPTREGREAMERAGIGVSSEPGIVSVEVEAKMHGAWMTLTSAGFSPKELVEYLKGLDPEVEFKTALRSGKFGAREQKSVAVEMLTVKFWADKVTLEATCTVTDPGTKTAETVVITVRPDPDRGRDTKAMLSAIVWTDKDRACIERVLSGSRDNAVIVTGGYEPRVDVVYEDGAGGKRYGVEITQRREDSKGGTTA